MANTYTQIHLHIVFATKYRKALIDKSWKEQLHKYITAVVHDHNHKMIQINSMPDHLHMLIGMRPHESASALVKLVKSESTKWINSKNFLPHKFAWQEGFGAFSYQKSALLNVILYIQKQEQHHKIKTLREEYINLLDEAEIEYQEQYIFSEPM